MDTDEMTDTPPPPPTLITHRHHVFGIMFRVMSCASSTYKAGDKLAAVTAGRRYLALVCIHVRLAGIPDCWDSGQGEVNVSELAQRTRPFGFCQRFIINFFNTVLSTNKTDFFE